MYNQVLAECQRYLPFMAISANTPLGVGQCRSTVSYFLVLPFGIEARVPITGIVISSQTMLAGFEATGTGTQNSTAIAISYYGQKAVQIVVTQPATLVAGNAITVQGSSQGYIYGIGAQI
jgi:hypothetical protein